MLITTKNIKNFKIKSFRKKQTIHNFKYFEHLKVFDDYK